MSNIKVSLPDGSVKEFEAGSSLLSIAKSLNQKLGKTALLAKVDGENKDLSDVLDHDAKVEFVTPDSEEGLHAIRHTASHVMAQAIQHLFPGTKFAIGPAIEKGFYYDLDSDHVFTPEDLRAIEKEMNKIIKANYPLVRKELSRAEALAEFKAADQPYKVELIEDLPEDAVISTYTQGDFTDLCAGPHCPSTGRVKAFKLMSIAGAYWRGDEHNKMLQRIYGTAFASKEDLEAYLHMMEEAEKRDHRRLGKELDLFHLQEEAPGMIFWHAKGWALWQQVEKYMRTIYQDNGYDEVKAPQVLDRSLWERSGHWAKYRENMFTTESENRYYALKPMNCPGHIQIFNSALRSYRDLPMRIGEFGQCHRNEPSGSLHGLMRVRGFTQDDGHIFCTEDQILAECEAYSKLVKEVYHTFGFDNIAYKVATRPAMRIGEDAAWDKAEAALMQSLDALGLKYDILPGEGAFYGPKIEYHLKDCLGRSWQCGTIQVDFQMPGRLGAEYVAEDNTRKTPVMLHRAIIGSLERWIGMLIEHYAGAMPVWLAPVQVAIANITEHQADYVDEIAAKMKAAGLRVQKDVRNEKINYKIRELSLQKIPYIVVVGEKEREAGTVAVRARGGKDLGVMKLEDFIARVVDENAQKVNN